MPRPAPERKLRRAVTALARLHPDDLALVLEALEPDERARIDALVAGLGQPEVPAGSEAEPVWSYKGVSPWLRARIDPDTKEGRANRDFILMTDEARAALVAAAAPFRTPAGTAGPGRSLLGQLWAMLGGARA